MAPPLTRSGPTAALSDGHMTPGFHPVVTWVMVFSSSSVPSAVSSLEVESSGRTDRLMVSWRHGDGSWSGYQVNTALELKTRVVVSVVTVVVRLRGQG